jgi:hypothetical protein
MIIESQYFHVLDKAFLVEIFIFAFAETDSIVQRTMMTMHFLFFFCPKFFFFSKKMTKRCVFCLDEDEHVHSFCRCVCTDAHDECIKTYTQKACVACKVHYVIKNTMISEPLQVWMMYTWLEVFFFFGPMVIAHIALAFGNNTFFLFSLMFTTVQSLDEPNTLYLKTAYFCLFLGNQFDSMYETFFYAMVVMFSVSYLSSYLRDSDLGFTSILPWTEAEEEARR